MNLLPLLALWLWRGGKGGGGGRSQPSTAPVWPSTISPPPVPAFAPQAPHESGPTPTAETATPLATLHAAPPKPPTTHAAPTAPVPKHTRAEKTSVKVGPAKILQRAPTAAHHAAARALSAKVKTVVPEVKTPHATLRAAVVADLQQIMIARGAKIKRDGLYGPKTAGAWTELAKKKGLPSEIKRVNSKIASVASQTYDALAVPPIP